MNIVTPIFLSDPFIENTPLRITTLLVSRKAGKNFLVLVKKDLFFFHRGFEKAKNNPSYFFEKLPEGEGLFSVKGFDVKLDRELKFFVQIRVTF